MPADVFDTPGSYTWTKPEGDWTHAIVTIIGPGGGGGAGAARSSQSATGGGAGGNGARKQLVYERVALPATVDVVIGAGGVGGLGSITQGNGNPGTNGSGPSLFGAESAGAGGGGGGGFVTTTSVDGGPGGASGGYGGAVGCPGIHTDSDQPGVSDDGRSGGGGSIGQIESNGVDGSPSRDHASPGGAGGLAPGGNGASGTASTVDSMGGGAGGGAASHNAAGNGGDGFRGTGGGGGGGARTGVGKGGGDGGAGGDGYVSVEYVSVYGTYYVGGDVIEIGNERIHKFRSTEHVIVPVITGNVEAMLVAGGGGGSGGYGFNNGGGGGAGGVLQTNGTILNDVQVYVGRGGHGSTTNPGGPGINGENTTLGAWTAIGGGRGSHSGAGAGTGGSGGGSFSGAGGAGTPGQGFDGGDSVSSNNGAGGGGGAGGEGESVSSGNVGGDGGPGITSAISGTPTDYAGGGGGGADGNGAFGGQATHGGGAGGGISPFHGADATYGTGGGGGGVVGSATRHGGDGATGVAFIRYTTSYEAPVIPPCPETIGPITLVGYEANWSNTSTVVVPVPAGVQEGDLLIAIMSSPSHPAVPVGWTDIVETGSIASRFLRGMYNFAGPSEPADYSFSGNDEMVGGIIALRGVDPSGTINVSASNTSASSPVVLSSMTTTVPDTVVITAAASTTQPSGSFTPPGGTVELWDINPSTDPDRSGNAVAWETVSAAGPIGTRTWSVSPSAQMGVIGFALKPGAVTTCPGTAVTAVQCIGEPPAIEVTLTNDGPTDAYFLVEHSAPPSLAEYIVTAAEGELVVVLPQTEDVPSVVTVTSYNDETWSFSFDGDCVASASPLQPATGALTCELGCPQTRAYILDFCGGNVLADVTDNITFLKWGRELDDDSEVEMTLHLKGDASGRACCEVLQKARTWHNELMLVRDGKVVWGPGPLVTIQVQRHVAHLVARDISAWLDHRVVHTDYNFVDADLGHIARTVIEDALLEGPARLLPVAVRDACILDYATFDLTGKHSDREVKANQQTAGEILRDLATQGLDWTVINRSLIVGTDFAFGPIGPLRDDHFQEDLVVSERGLAAATKWYVSSDNAQGSCGGVNDYFYLLESAVEGQPAATSVADLNREACDRLRGTNPPPLIVTVPSTGRLAPSAPVCMEVLVPGTMIDISVRDLCRPADVRERLTSLRVTCEDKGESVGITLAPLGEFIAAEVVEG